MHKTIYIDPEDEITNIVSKIRREAADEIYLVVPKNAMLVQGVINLEILRREASRVNKNIIFVTNDKQTKNLLERLELDVREGVEDDFVDDNVSIEDEEIVNRTAGESIRQANMIRKSKEIGSGSFYEEENVSPEEIRTVLQDDEPISIEEDEENIIEGKRKKMNVKRRDVKTEKVSPRQARKIIRHRYPGKTREKYYEDRTERERIDKRLDPRFEIRQKEAEDFFLSKKPSETEVDISSRKTNSGRSGGKLKFFVWLLAVLLVLGALGSWIFINLPKVKIIVYPMSEPVSKDIDVSASSSGGGSWENNEILGQMEEFEISHELRFDTSGEKFSSDKGKARGTVKILNNYSSVGQPLVATTRILSEEGKLFRLSESVTVPGMENGQPGEVEAKVVADEPGAEYNIEASKFTIEGFKGSPKYEKFEVASNEKMEGGMDNVDNQKVKVVTQSDIESARGKVIDSFNNAMEAKIREKIGEGKEFLADSIEKEITQSDSSLDAGEIGDQFTFTLKQKVRMITFYEDDVKNLAIKNLEKEVPEGYELDGNSIQLDYEKGNSDFEKGQLKFKVAARGNIWPKINRDEIKEGVAHKSEEEIKEFLLDYSRIRKAEIEFSPVWLSFLPITQGKVIIEENKQ